MKNIRTKITVPFLVTIIIVPLITMILFNIALRIYFAKNAVKELKNTVSAVETFIRNQMKDDDFSDGKIQTMLGSLKPILKASRLAANTELILFNKNLEVVYPSNPKSTDTFITDSLISGIRSILPSSEKNKVYTIRVGRIRYMAVGSRLVQSSLPRSSYVVFVTPVNSGSSAIRTFNIILLLILFIAVLICSFIAFGVSKSISKPIVKLCGYAGRIGRGEFIKVPSDRSSKEINDLCLSMNEMSEQLLNSTNTQRTFLQNASHEFRTPLMSIQGYAEGIIKGVLPTPKRLPGSYAMRASA
jgi:methyl-accepting chemotaxis protein